MGRLDPQILWKMHQRTPYRRAGQSLGRLSLRWTVAHKRTGFSQPSTSMFNQHQHSRANIPISTWRRSEQGYRPCEPPRPTFRRGSREGMHTKHPRSYSNFVRPRPWNTLNVRHLNKALYSIARHLTTSTGRIEEYFGMKLAYLAGQSPSTGARSSRPQAASERDGARKTRVCHATVPPARPSQKRHGLVADEDS